MIHALLQARLLFLDLLLDPEVRDPQPTLLTGLNSV
jgi:hypothetical protein